MHHDLWPELMAAASDTSGLNVHEYASKLLLQLDRDLRALPNPDIFEPRVSVTDTRFLGLAASALKVTDGLRTRARRAGTESSAFHQELNSVLQQVSGLFRRLDIGDPREALDRYRFNEAALDWMDTLGIHPPGPGGALTWTRPRKLMPLEEIHKTILSNDSLLKAMLSPPAPKTTEEWVRETRHWQTLRSAWVPVLEDFCTQSATISGELEPV